MPRLHGSNGSAIVFALVAVLLIASLGVFTIARASDSNSRSGAQRVNSVADSAADAAVAAAISRIQRVGSVRGQGQETNGSTLDVTNADINSADATDGTYSLKIQSGQPGCYHPRQRLLTVTAKAEGQTRRRYLCFWIIPRTMRFGLYVDGRSDTDKAIDIGTGFSVLTPPPYKAPTGARGSDIGSNGEVSFAAGSGANNRLGLAQGLNQLYDHLFVPAGRTPTTSVANRFGSESEPGIRWGGIYRAPRMEAGGETQAPSISLPAAGVYFDSPSALNSSQAPATPSPVTLATRTQPPDFSQKMKLWRDKATTQGNAYLPGEGATSTPAEFQDQMNQLGTQTIQGVVYVACEDNATITIPSGKQLTIDGGALIMEGCNLKIDSGGGLAVKRDLSDPYAKLKGNSAGSCTSRGELTAVPGGCAWAYPGLAVMQNPDREGGNVLSDASGSKYVDINGNVIIGRDLTINGGTLPSGGRSGNWNTAGITFVDGKLSASGTGAAVFRWVAQAQRMDFDSSTGRMGTYSLRTEERALPTSAPTVTFQEKPSNPSEQINQANFTWTIDGDYDTVSCTLASEGGPGRSSQPATDYPCSDLAATVNDLEYPNTYTFTVKACVLGLDSTRNQVQFCDTASHDWYIKGPAAEIYITNDSKPSDPAYSRNNTFQWETTWMGERYAPQSVQCRIDGGAWADCQSPPGYAAENLSEYQSHTFDVKACNSDGCGTDSYEWTVEGPPIINITNKPSSPQPYTNTSTTLNWTVDARGVTSTQCATEQGENPNWFNCATPTSHTIINMQTNQQQYFQVKVCNPAGCVTDSADWFINPLPPTVAIITKPVSPQGHTATTPTFSWVTGGGPIAATECRRDGGAWFACTSPYTASWNNCATRTFEVRVTNATASASDTHSWQILCTPPTIAFTNVPANPSAYTAKAGSFNWVVNNGSPVTGYECQVDGGAWFACGAASSSSGYTTASLNNNAVYGVGHSFSVRAVNNGGTGEAISNSWTIYPDPVNTPYFYAGLGDVDYPSGSQIGYFTAGGGARIWQCYSTAQGWWYDCGDPNWFAAAGYCDRAYTYVRAYNITSGWVQSAAGSFRRYCDPPSMTLRWEYPSGRITTENGGWRPITQWMSARAYPSWCRYYRDPYGGGRDYPWSSGGWCGNPFYAGYIGQSSWFGIESNATANDGTRTVGHHSWANYNSDGWGRICVIYFGKPGCP